MKKLLLITLFALFSNLLFAQWTTSGNVTSTNTKVGIGTSNPLNSLDINGGIYANNTSSINGVAFNTADVYYKQLQAVGFNLRILSGDGTASLLLPYTNNTPVYFKGYGLSVDGSMGIGTLSPSQKLSVDGNIHIQNSTASGKGFLFSSPASNWGPPTSGLFFIPRDNVNAIADFKVDLWNGVGYTITRFFINGSNGNIGIGTSSPDEKLTVSGTIHASQIKVNTDIPVPDYVFKKDYKLLPLAALETYLDENQHLPEIPSASEQEKEGLDLGKMNQLLLKKVEELTLYLIKKDKEDKVKQKQIDQLKKSNALINKKLQILNVR